MPRAMLRSGQPMPAVREDRIDVIRGISLLMIFVGHANFAFSEAFQHSRGFSDAAEFFVLLAGMSAALAYHRPELPFFDQIGPVLRRCWTLYKTHILTTAMFLLAAIPLSRLLTAAPQTELSDLMAFWEQPYRHSIEVLGLIYMPDNLDILPLYCVLLAALPIVMICHRRSERGLLAASAALWLTAGALHLDFVNRADANGVWYLNPLSWQLIFVIGFCLGVRIRNGTPIFAYHRQLFRLGCIFLVVAIPLQLLFHYGVLFPSDAKAYRLLSTKTYLGVLPLVHVLVALYVVWNIPAIQNLREVNWLRPVYAAGRNSLPVFVTGLALSALTNVELAANPNATLVDDLLLLAFGILVQLACALWFEARRTRKRVLVTQ